MALTRQIVMVEYNLTMNDGWKTTTMTPIISREKNHLVEDPSC